MNSTSPLDTLRDLTAALAVLDGRAVPEVLTTVWRGFEQAVSLGHQVGASGGDWERLHRNARSVEISLHTHLRSSAPDWPLCLPVPPADLPPIKPDNAAAAVTVLIDYAEAARRALLAGAEQATNWDDVRPCGHGSHLCGELAAAWRGLRPDFRP